jgi:hypothetical protein
MTLAVVGVASLLRCEMSFGAPTPLIVLPDRTITAEFMLMGNIMDFVPLLNIEPFGECISLLNPEVLAATIAAFGVLQPQPCIPVTTTPWISEALDVLVEGFPAIDQTAILMCDWAGPINVIEPGNLTVMVP